MKKFLEEFKEIALKGNVMSLAIGVIIGGAFQSLVTSFTDCFITPITTVSVEQRLVDIFRYSIQDSISSMERLFQQLSTS